MNASTLYWKSSEDRYAAEIQQVMNELFNDFIDKKIFAQEKKDTIDRFKSNYKDLEFRGRIKMMEFSHQNKNYSLEHLTQDLLNVTMDHVRKLRKHLLFPRNLFLFIHGLADKEILKQLKIPKMKQKQVQYLFAVDNFHFLQDEAFVKKSKDDYECGCLKFERGPTFDSISKEFAVLTLLGEILFKGYFSIEVDHMDASIMYFDTPLRKYKYDIFTSIDRDNVEKAKMRFLRRFDQFIGQQPFAFVEFAARLHFDKINIYEWYKNIKELTAAEIRNFIQERNYKIREGYVQFYKEESQYGIV